MIYSYMTKVARFNKKIKNCIIFFNILLAIRSVSHSKDILVPFLSETWKSSSECDTINTNVMEVDYEPPTNYNPKPFNQVELNDLIKDLNLLKQVTSTQLLDSKLK